MKKGLMLKSVLLLVLLLVPMLAWAGNGASGKKGGMRGPERVADELIVKFADGFPASERLAVLAKYGLQKKRDSNKAGAFSVFKHANPQAVLAGLRALPGVVYAEQNAYAYASSWLPNDPFYHYQWNMQRIGMEAAWEVAAGAGTVVAVIDTGVRQTLADLAQTAFRPGYDFVNLDSDPDDDEGHGSHVCGTIAQSTDNGIGVAGIAWQAAIMPVKVLDASGSGSYDDIADGIIWAADQGADIINLSLGGSADLHVLQEACEYAWNKGVLLVVAAGNEASSAPSYPAAYDVCLSVSATSSQDTLASYSNYGATIDIAAPGGDSGDFDGDGYDDMILQNTFSRYSEGYYFYAGTSMAAPHVAGVAALVKGLNPALTNADLRAVLESSAEDLGAAGWDEQFGNGLLDAAAAVAAAGGTESFNQPPVANFFFAVDALQGYFTDLSFDPDGYVENWEWDFGDGSRSDLISPGHLYAEPGTYAVTLTVTDNGSGVDSVTRQVMVHDGSVTISVADIELSKIQRGRSYQLQAKVSIKNSLGQAVAGATVSAAWSGAIASTAAGVTDAAGVASFMSLRYRTDAAVTFTVTGVADALYRYDPENNIETEETTN